MPKLAMMPSWATPRYEVGVSNKNPAAAAPAASERGMPRREITVPAVSIDAADQIGQRSPEPRPPTR